MNKLKISALAAGIAQILIYGDIEERWWCDEQVNDAQDIINQLNAITESKIQVRIKSNGGNLVEALTMRNLLAERAKTAEITFFIDGVVASAATVIPMIAGTKTIMASNALFMIHAPAAGYSTGRGTAIDHQKTAEILNKYAEAWAQNICEKTGKTLAEVLPLLTDNEDHYYSAQEALDFGFIDQIGDSVPITASAIPKKQNLPKSWLDANKITITATANTPTQQTGNTPMTATTETKPEAPNPPAGDVTVTAKAKTPQQIETERQNSIKALFALIPETDIHIHALQKVMLVDASIDEAAARKQILAKMGENQFPVAQSHHVVIGAEGRDKFRDDAVNAILTRAGVSHESIKASRDNPLIGMPFYRLAEECLRVNGTQITQSDSRYIVGQAFTQSASDFPYLLENALNKSLLIAYNTQASTWRRFCKIGSLADFRPHYRYRESGLTTLDDLSELGEIKHKAVNDATRESITGKTKANIITLSRQSIVNDDMGAFISIAQKFGRAGVRTIEKDVYALLALNPALNDGIAVFHASHGNLGTAGAPGVSSIDQARQLMMSQKIAGSVDDYLDIMPSIFIGGVATSGAAKVANNSEYDPDTANKLQRTNIVKGVFSDIVESPRIAGNAWYVFADPNEAPVIEVAFLNGTQDPIVEMQKGWDQDGVSWRVMLDYAVGFVGFEGAVKNAGA